MAQIIESKNIQDVLEHVSDNSLVVFDVDNTLIQTIEEFGSHAWACHMSNRLEEKGIDMFLARQKSCAAFIKICDLLSYKTVEPTTLDVLTHLDDKNIQTMGLTLRPFSLVKETIQQLASVSIDFSKKAIHHKEILVDTLVGFTKGIYYAGLKENKGRCLISFLEEISYTADHVVFVDDSHHHTEEVYKVLVDNDIDGVCVRYGAADEASSSFDPARAEKELLRVLGTERYNEILKELL